MDTYSSQPHDGPYHESLVVRVEVPADDRMDLSGGAKKSFEAFDPDAVMLVPPSLNE